MQFFTFFPTVNYTFQDANTQFTLTMVNPTVHVRLVEAIKKNITVLYDYVIQDDERPDTVSVNLYGTPDYTWVVLLLNNIFTLFDWPLTNDEFTKYLVEKYGSVATANATLLYRTFDGYYIDLTTWTALTTVERMAAQTAYDFEADANDAKRRIRVVPTEFVAPIALELKKLLTT
jgi:hypothetical protein